MSAKILGILGGGQLGRMSAQAAKKLGIQTVILTPEENSPASQVADKTIVAPYDDKDALEEFAAAVDVISYEFENIPTETVNYLKSLKPVYPDERLLEVAQDRIKEKSYLNDIGIPTARWSSVESVEQLNQNLKSWNQAECILKTIRFGYDGKGQWKFGPGNDFNSIRDDAKSIPLIMEEIVPFSCEISIIVARDQFGKTVTYGPALNEHRNHILHSSTVPAGLDTAIEDKARELGIALAEHIELVGVLALELFVTKDGALLANEIAPRTHNSGHWSIDACAHSQFENHVRAVCGLPVEPPGRHSACTMINLIGHDIDDLSQYEADQNAHIHLYGKAEAREGRKMGHVTILHTK